jgi:hypothetical protein
MAQHRHEVVATIGVSVAAVMAAVITPIRVPIVGAVVGIAVAAVIAAVVTPIRVAIIG